MLCVYALGINIIDNEKLIQMLNKQDKVKAILKDSEEKIENHASKVKLIN